MMINKNLTCPIEIKLKAKDKNRWMNSPKNFQLNQTKVNAAGSKHTEYPSYSYIYKYTYICTVLIKETASQRKLIFGKPEFFVTGPSKFELTYVNVKLIISTLSPLFIIQNFSLRTNHYKR